VDAETETDGLGEQEAAARMLHICRRESARDGDESNGRQKNRLSTARIWVKDMKCALSLGRGKRRRASWGSYRGGQEGECGGRENVRSLEGKWATAVVSKSGQ